MDCRKEKTKKYITKVFIDLLCKYDFSKITVTMICDKAQIQRPTFYSYFSSKYDLLSETYKYTQKDFENMLMLDAQNKSFKINDKNKIVIFLSIIDKYKSFFLYSKIDAEFIKTYMIPTLKKLYKKSDYKNDNYELLFTIQEDLLTGIYRYWKTNPTLSLDEMINTLEEIGAIS